MKISRLEIFGFKSFLERVVLPIDQGITAIVGPNGCGKSNIVDALRWIFGESRASQLRGALLEDVIFNGTETLRPLGLAEVSLVISTEKASLYEDILATKRSTEESVRAAASEEEPRIDTPDAVESDQQTTSEPEFVNGRPHLVVIEGALSAKSIEAAAKEQEENNQSVEKEEIVAEAASLDDSLGQQQLPSSANEEDPALARFSWLKLSREVEVTRRLYRSGESEFFINKVACRLRDLKDLFRLLGLGARSYTLVAQGEVSKIITSKPEERRLMIEEAAGVSGVRERLAAAKKRLEDTKISLTRLNDLLVEVTRQVNSLRVQATRARNRAEIKERLQFLDLSVLGDRLKAFAEKGTLLETEVQELIEKESISKEQLESLLSAEDSIQRELVEYNARRESLSQQLRRGRAELAARVAQKSALESEAQALEHQLKTRAIQHEELSQRAAIAAEQMENATAELAQFTEAISELLVNISSLEKSSSEELRHSGVVLEAAREEINRSQSKVQDLRSVSHSLSARLEAIDEQLLAQNQALSASCSSEELKELLSSLTPLLKHVHAPSAYRKALEVSIANCANFQICENLQEFLSKILQNNNLGTASANLQVRARTPLNENLAVPAEGESTFPRLLSVLDIEASYSALFEELLGNIYLCESVEQAVAQVSSSADKASIYVTQSGELLSANSFTLFRDTSGPVELYARRRELSDEHEAAELIVLESVAEKDRLQAALIEAEDRHQFALQKSVETEQEIRRLTSDLGAMRGKAEVISRLVTQLGNDRATLESSMQNWQEEQSTFQLRLDDLRTMLSISSDSDSLPMDQEMIDQLEEQLDEINSRGKDMIDSLEERSRTRDRARYEYEELTAYRSKSEFEFEKISIERHATESRLHDLYPEVDPKTLLDQPTLCDEDRISFSEEAERLRSKIIREGEVDPSSIALFEQEEARLAELKAQKSDLESAEKTLVETVTQLSELARRRFLETFKIVQKNFGQLIPRVFGGGFGSLQLENPDDPFEGGIDVTVRPPGKKPKSIELLSGGERALCAIAMIFSMFLHKPSPLCVLDEVDAPLDEANLRRYLTMVREMSSVTQFLMISHNKEAMSAADRLVGVTQEQPGASRVVTVSLEQAQAAVA